MSHEDMDLDERDTDGNLTPWALARAAIADYGCDEPSWLQRSARTCLACVCDRALQAERVRAEKAERHALRIRANRAEASAAVMREVVAAARTAAREALRTGAPGRSATWCWCDSGGRPDADHSPSCQALRRLSELVERYDREGRAVARGYPRIPEDVPPPVVRGSCARCGEPGGFKNACGHRFHARCWQEHYPDCEPCRVQHREDERTENGELRPARVVTPC